MVDTKTLIKTMENHIYHRNLSSVAPILSAKKSSSLEQAVYGFFFPEQRHFQAHSTENYHIDFDDFWCASSQASRNCSPRHLGLLEIT